jgi:Mu transposase, C-terminal domain
MARLPAAPPDLDPRIVMRVPADPHVRVDTCDYSLDPRLVGRRVEVRIGQREITATALDSGEIAARHRRSYARQRTISDLEHLRLLKAGRHRPSGEPEVERRPLARYDALIPA